jgi:pimeloyl-ACP methyl ester carboxylesterase
MKTMRKIHGRLKGARSGSSEKRPSRKGPKAKLGTFQTSDGIEIAYGIEGEGPDLLFCYGLVCSTLHWTYQIEILRKKYRCIWFDYRGHGESETPPEGSSLSIDRLTQDVLELMDHLQIEKPVILGHSMGVNIVLEAARRAPSRFSGMVLANGTPRDPIESLFGSNFMVPIFEGFAKANEALPAVIRTIWKAQNKLPIGAKIIGKLGFNLNFTPIEDVQTYIDHISQIEPRVFVELIKSYRKFDATPWLHELKLPTLVIAGEYDRVIPVQQQRLMSDLIPGAELLVVEDGSHCPQLDFPEDVTAKIDDFIHRILTKNPQ